MKNKKDIAKNYTIKIYESDRANIQKIRKAYGFKKDTQSVRFAIQTLCDNLTSIVLKPK